MRKEPFNASEKLAMIQELELGEISMTAAAYKFGINESSLKNWCRRYKVYGYEGLEIRSHNRSYSAELKQ